MPIAQHHQLTVLSDILKSQQVDCCATASEYEQIKRLSKIILDGNPDQHMQDTLENIHSYGSIGAEQSEFEQHIYNNQTEFSGWLQALDTHTYGH